MTDTVSIRASSPAPRGPGPEHVSTVIIGAGQAGLTTAYFLGQAGHRCVVLHQNARVGDQWRQRYDSLHLNTPAKYDALPGMAFPAPRFSFPTGHDMADYLERYAEQMQLTVHGGVRVTGVHRMADGCYLVAAGGTTYVAENVVIATGGEHHPKVPDFATALDPGIRQLHSHDYRNPDQLIPGPALVVGAGQSGADLALELAQAGHETWLSGRVNGEIPVRLGGLKSRIAAPVLWFVANHVLTLRTPVGRKAQPRVRAGGTPLIRVKRSDLAAAGVHHTEQRTQGVRDGMPVLDDGQTLDVANVVWCTGFRQDFGFIEPPITGPDGWPADDGGIVPGSPGLFFVGLLYQRGFYSMLIGGARRDAAFIARAVTARSRDRVAI